MAVRIVSDTACDLPASLVEEAGIELVPLLVRFGSTELVDRDQLTTSEFWSRCAVSTDLPETSAPSPGTFLAAFERLLGAGGAPIVCVTLSSRLSATYEAAAQAARELGPGGRAEVVDSLSVTMGEGLVALAAADAANAGAPAEEVVAAALSARQRLEVFGVIDTLENLRKGGRIGGAKALLGTLLSIKPVIEVRDGVVEEESRQRTRTRSFRYLADKIHAAGPLERLAVVNGAAPDFDYFVRLIDDVSPARPRIVGDIGPIIGTHAGRGAVGAAWVRAERAPG